MNPTRSQLRKTNMGRDICRALNQTTTENPRGNRAFRRADKVDENGNRARGERGQHTTRLAWPVRDGEGNVIVQYSPAVRAVKRVTGGRTR